MTTEEDTAIDHMIATFRAKNRMTLQQLMEVDSMNLDRFSQGPKDKQDVLVPKAEERPRLYRSQAEIERLKRLDPDWSEEDE